MSSRVDVSSGVVRFGRVHCIGWSTGCVGGCVACGSERESSSPEASSANIATGAQDTGSLNDSATITALS